MCVRVFVCVDRYLCRHRGQLSSSLRNVYVPHTCTHDTCACTGNKMYSRGTCAPLLVSTSFEVYISLEVYISSEEYISFNVYISLETYKSFEIHRHFTRHIAHELTTHIPTRAISYL